MNVVDVNLPTMIVFHSGLDFGFPFVILAASYLVSYLLRN